MTVDVAGFARGFSRQVESRLAALDRVLRSESRRQAREEKRRQRERERSRAKWEALVAPRRKDAQAGLERLKEFAWSWPLACIFSSLEKLRALDHDRGFTLFSVERPSGDWWDHTGLGEAQATREVVVECCPDYLLIYAGSWNASLGRGDDEWQFYPDGSVLQRNQQGSRVASPEDFWKYLGEFPDAVDLALVARTSQRTFEWDPSVVAFEFLVRCADEETFDRYVTASLHRLQRTLSPPK